MLYLGCLTVSIFSVFHYMDEMYALVIFQLPILFINIVNVVLLRYHQRLELAMNIVLGTIFVFLLGTAMIGGLANTGKSVV